MAGKSNTSATFFAQKKLLGKSHTSNLKTDGEELIGSNIQAATSLVFGEEIPTSPEKTNFLISSASADVNGTVEYITFALTAITGTTYDADSSGGGGGSDSGEGSQSSGPHSYKFVLPTDYVVSSSNSKKGNGVFDNGRILHESLGKIQLIPPFFSQDAPNPYIIKIYKDDGSGGVGSEIPLLDNVDWNVDFYNGVLFLQDYDASKIPAHAKGFIYVGKMADEVISSGSSSGGSVAGADTQVQFNDGGSFGGDSGLTFNKTTDSLKSTNLSGSLTNLSDGSSYIVAGSGIAISSGSGQIQLKTSKEMVFNEKVTGTVDGTNTRFTLANTPFDNSEVSLFVNGQLQTPPGLASFQDYSVTGSIIHFTTGAAPPDGSLILALYNKAT